MTILAIIQHSTEVIACITSVIFIRSLYRQGWILWVPFLVYTCIIDIWGGFVAEASPDSTTGWLYNPYIIISTTFYIWFLIYITPLSPSVKPVLYKVLFLLAACTLAGYLIWGSRTNLLHLVLVTGSVIICLLCLLFFYTLIKKPTYDHSLLRVPGFWIVAGLLIFYTGISLYTSVYDFLAEHGIIMIKNDTIQNFIPQVLSIFLYSGITIAITQCRYRLKT